MLLLRPGIAGAQNGLDPAKELEQYNFNNWDADKGLPNNAVLRILQTREGYIWIATYSGVVRFNGLGFVSYTTSNTPEFLSNTFSDLGEDTKGELWMSSSGGGVNCYREGNIQTYTTDKGLPSNIVDALITDQQGVMWAGTVKGLAYFRGNRFVQDGLPQEIKSAKVQKLYVDSKGYLWICTNGDGLFQLDARNKGKIIRHYKEDLGADIVQAIHEDKKGDFWVGTDKGLCRIQQGVPRIYTLNLSDQSVTSVYEDITGNLWIGTFSGLVRLRGEQIEQFPADNPLSETRILDIRQDREGNLWVGTYRNGLFKISDGMFINYSANSATDYVVHSVIELNTNEFIIAHEKGIGILNRRKNQITEMDLHKDGITGLVKSALIDSKKNLWICSRDGLIRYTGNKVKRFTTREGLPDNYTRTICEDHRGNLWVGTQAGMACVSGDSVRQYTTADGLSDNTVLSVMEDSRHNIWVSTRHGINRIDNTSKQRKITAFNASNGLASDVTFKAFEDADGRLWIGSNRGITHYKDGRFTRITSRNGLYTDQVFQILEDNSGHFWITTNGSNVGVFKVERQALIDFVEGRKTSFTSIGYNRSDGMKASESTANSTGIKASDGSLWFPTLRGVEVIDPARISINRQKPPVIIEEFIADHISVNATNSIELSPGKQRIEIRYAGLSFTAPQNVKYKCKLEGYDRDWIDAGTRNEASYTNLPPGNYTFRVIACNNDGIWNHQGASLKFYMSPFFYQTRWFMSLIILLITISGAGIYQWRVRQLNRAKQHLERLVAHRTEQIMQQKEELAEQKEAIEIQHRNIEAQKQELESAYDTIQNKNKHITDSIRYARTIQQATLPNTQHIAEALGEHFVIYRPKDIVSGDFYWFSKVEDVNKIFIAAVDCTGHGVPGAFMSMIGNLLLSEIVNHEGIYDPARIFEMLDARVQTALQQKEQSNSDGMDICLCVIEKTDAELVKVTFAGAKRPLYYLPNGKTIQAIRGDSSSIGGRQRKKPYSSHELELEKGSMIYLTTDGFADQNDPAKEKFGYLRLITALAEASKLPVEEQQIYLEHQLDDFKKEADQRDDITLIGIMV